MLISMYFHNELMDAGDTAHLNSWGPTQPPKKSFPKKCGSKKASAMKKAKKKSNKRAMKKPNKKTMKTIMKKVKV